MSLSSLSLFPWAWQPRFFFRKTCISHSEVRWGKNEIFFLLSGQEKDFFPPTFLVEIHQKSAERSKCSNLGSAQFGESLNRAPIGLLFGLAVSLLFHRGRGRGGGDSHQSHYVHKCSSLLPLLLLLFWPCKCKRPLRREGGGEGRKKNDIFHKREGVEKAAEGEGRRGETLQYSNFFVLLFLSFAGKVSMHVKLRPPL